MEIPIKRTPDAACCKPCPISMDLTWEWLPPGGTGWCLRKSVAITKGVLLVQRSGWKSEMLLNTPKLPGLPSLTENNPALNVHGAEVEKTPVCVYFFEIICLPWRMWFSGWSISLQTTRYPVHPGRAHAWVSGQVRSKENSRSNHTLMFLSLSFSFPSPTLKINK